MRCFPKIQFMVPSFKLHNLQIVLGIIQVVLLIILVFDGIMVDTLWMLKKDQETSLLKIQQSKPSASDIYSVYNDPSGLNNKLNEIQKTADNYKARKRILDSLFTFESTEYKARIVLKDINISIIFGVLLIVTQSVKMLTLALGIYHKNYQLLVVSGVLELASFPFFMIFSPMVDSLAKQFSERNVFGKSSLTTNDLFKRHEILGNSFQGFLRYQIGFHLLGVNSGILILVLATRLRRNETQLFVRNNALPDFSDSSV